MIKHIKLNNGDGLVAISIKNTKDALVIVDPMLLCYVQTMDGLMTALNHYLPFNRGQAVVLRKTNVVTDTPITNQMMIELYLNSLALSNQEQVHIFQNIKSSCAKVKSILGGRAIDNIFKELASKIAANPLNVHEDNGHVH